MSALLQAAPAGRRADDAGPMAAELDGLRASIERRLRAAGVRLPPGELAALADDVLADALRIALLWVEPG